MPELVTQRFGVTPSATSPDYRAAEGESVDFSSDANAEIGAKWRQGWGPRAYERLQSGLYPTDPNYHAWDHLDGYEEFASDLGDARSADEMAAKKAMIDSGRADRATAARGQLGFVGDLIAGVFDPANLIPIPAVKGIGLVRGALTLAGTFTAIGAGTEVVRQYADPLAEPGEMVGNIAMAGLLGGVVGAPVGAWGARAGRRMRAARDFERGISDVDSPNFSLKPRGADEGLRIEYERPGLARDGSRPRFATSDDFVGYRIKPHGGVNYVYEDGIGWHPASERGAPVTTRVSAEVADALGLPESVTERVMRIDEVGLKAEHRRAGWQDELAELTDDATPIEQVIRDANDYVNFRTIEHLWEKRLPQEAGETAADWHTRVGKEAMQEFRASKVTGAYAGPEGLAWIAERLNFSPLAKAIRMFEGDNVVADLALRIGGDYGWAIKANEFGWSTPPSMLLKGLRHTARWVEWRAEFDREWLRLVTGNQSMEGKVAQGLNLSAAGYAAKQGARRAVGANVLTYGDFEEMVARAVFEKGDFEVNGFAVNQNARNAAKAFSRMMEEYDDLHRATGNFRDQKNITRDIKHWQKQRLQHQAAVMKWLFGATGEPSSYSTAIRVTTAGAGRNVPGQLLQEFGPTERVFTGETHADAIQAMVDELGDEGIRLSEQLTADNYGYVPRRAAAPEAAAIEPRVDLPSVIPEGQDFILQAEVGLDSHAAGPYDWPAVRYEGQTTTGAGHWDAVRAMMELDDDFQYAFEENPELYLGFQRSTERRLPYLQMPGLKADMAPDKFMSDIRPAEPTPREIPSGYDYNPLLEGIDTAGGMLDRIRETVDDPDYLSLIDILQKDIGTVPVEVFHLETLADELERGDHSAGTLLAELEGIVGKYRPFQDNIWLRGRWGDKPSGLNVTTMLHEGVHAATLRRLHDGFLDWQAKVDSPYARTYARLDELRGHVSTLLETRRRELFADLDLAGRQDLQQRVDYMMSDPHELLTMALSEKPIRDWLKTMPAGNPRGPIRTAWDELLHWIAETLGWQNPTRRQLSKLDELMSFTEEVTGLRQPGGDRGAGDAFMRAFDQQFVKQQDMIDGRVRMLSPKQEAIYAQRKGALDMADERLAELEADLKTVTEKPHEFTDAAGNREPYYHRIWDKTKGASEREQLTRLFTKWFERDQPDGARTRAEAAVDNILNDDAPFPGSGGMTALNQRTLNVPNSWSISDPEFGELRVSDFIDKRILSVAEHYVKRSGIRIEAARMFGDAELRAEKARLREYLLDRYYDKATTDAERTAVMAQIHETEGLLEITRKSVLGVIRTSDPWRLDNRASRLAKNFTQLTVMGKVAFTSLPEIFRGAMTQGIGNYFRTIFVRYLDDLDSMRGNIEFGGLTGELNDMALTSHNARIVSMEDGEPVTGGTTFERWIDERIPGFFKLSGLTSLTIWQKQMTMLAAQHVVMDEARRIGAAIASGVQPSQKDVLRLAALGIKPRDALLLSRMPIEFKDGGKLILPAVDAWKALGADGRQAREALLTAIHAEARRTIVTPSIGDRSTIFNGVWTSKGKVVAQSDLMTVPMQFLSYGVGAHNKMLTSMVQGRDRAAVMGMFYVTMGGMLANYLKADENTWHSKSYGQIIYEAMEAGGLGGFWLGDLNKQLERASNERWGVKPMLGLSKPGKKPDIVAAIGALGPAPGHFADLSRAFWDDSVTGSQRAQLIRRGVPYNNLIYWERIFKGLANEAAGAFGATKQ